MRVIAKLSAKPSAEHRRRFNVVDNPEIPYVISMERQEALLETLTKNQTALVKVYDANDTTAYDKLKKEQEIKLKIDLCNTFNEILVTMSDQDISFYRLYKNTRLPKLEYGVYKKSLVEIDILKKKKYNIISNNIFIRRMADDESESRNSSFRYNNEKVDQYLIKMLNPIFSISQTKQIELTSSNRVSNSSTSIPDKTICIVTGEKITLRPYYLNYIGKVYAFCCTACLSKFKANPAKFVK